MVIVAPGSSVYNQLAQYLTKPGPAVLFLGKVSPASWLTLSIHSFAVQGA